MKYGNRHAINIYWMNDYKTKITGITKPLL
jgi:hypothetical protein